MMPSGTRGPRSGLMAPLHTFEARKARTARPRVVAAVLCHRALGDRFICIFVDNRLLQLGEAGTSCLTFQKKAVRGDREARTSPFATAQLCATVKSGRALHESSWRSAWVTTPFVRVHCSVRDARGHPRLWNCASRQCVCTAIPTAAACFASSSGGRCAASATRIRLSAGVLRGAAPPPPRHFRLARRRASSPGLSPVHADAQGTDHRRVDSLRDHLHNDGAQRSGIAGRRQFHLWLALPSRDWPAHRPDQFGERHRVHFSRSRWSGSIGRSGAPHLGSDFAEPCDRKKSDRCAPRHAGAHSVRSRGVGFRSRRYVLSDSPLG